MRPSKCKGLKTRS